MSGKLHESANERPESRLRTFIAKFSEHDQRRIRAVRAALRKRLPTANELVYDNYNFFVIGYSPTLRPSDSVLSIAARADGLGICFIHGARLADPQHLLQGSGRQTRFLRVESADQLSDADVEALITQAVARAKPFAARGRGALVIRSVSGKQRPRRRPFVQPSAPPRVAARQSNASKHRLRALR
jgi:hypothetical protein